MSPNNSPLPPRTPTSCIWQSNLTSRGSSRNNACEPPIFISPTRSTESFTRSDRLFTSDHAELSFVYEWWNIGCLFEQFATGAAPHALVDNETAIGKAVVEDTCNKVCTNLRQGISHFYEKSFLVLPVCSILCKPNDLKPLISLCPICFLFLQVSVLSLSYECVPVSWNCYRLTSMIPWTQCKIIIIDSYQG